MKQRSSTPILVRGEYMFNTSRTNRPVSPTIVLSLGLMVALLLGGQTKLLAGNTISVPRVLTPLPAVSQPSNAGQVLEVAFDAASFNQLALGADNISMSFPLPAGEEVLLELERFDVVAPDARILVSTPSGVEEIQIPRVIMFRGQVAGEPGSHVFLAFTEQGSGNGSVTLASGERYFLSHGADKIGGGEWGTLTIQKEGPYSDLPDDVPFCGVETPDDFVPITITPDKQAPWEAGGPRLKTVAVECDQEFCDLFNGNVYAGAAYVAQLLGAVSDIYERDLGVRLVLRFVRLWPNGGEPFEASNLSGFAGYWYQYEPFWDYNLVQLFSGRRDLGYGGIAYVSGTCNSNAFAIQARLNGSFPVPVGWPNMGNWDVNVIAHEMGHNFGSYHTHDGYIPHIDDCGNGVPSRGEIMSYCYTQPGYMLNVDLRFHARVQELIQYILGEETCTERDCNGNSITDSDDIAQGRSLDVNADNIPDECEDCNGNGTLDDVDIAGGMPDVNGNGVPDVCEPDCNGNGVPDPYELTYSGLDQDGNNVPDECQTDCNNNNFADNAEVWLGIDPDLDRNAVPDNCQDCDANGIGDWLDLGRQHNMYISDAAFEGIREYHGASSYVIKNITGSSFNDPGYMVFGSDRQLYVSNRGNDCVLRVNVDNDQVTVFVPAGSGGLDQPQGLVFASDGNLLVASCQTNNILEFDGLSGAYVGEFVPSGTGGLVSPLAMELGPNGNLFAATATGKVLEFDGDDGAFVREFVTAGSGGLSDPRGIAFMPGGNLLAVSGGSGLILEYAAETGNFVRVFNLPPSLNDPRDVAVSPDGLIYVITGADRWVRAFFPHNGAFCGGYVRNDPGLLNPYAMAFRPASPDDCDGNGVLDQCDIASGILHDENLNGAPDECESGDFDGDGTLNADDNCPWIPNPDHNDADMDNVGDVCDNCVGVPNIDQGDYDHDGVGDACDVCPGFDDHLDADGDGVADGCDACPGHDDNIDADGDGVPDPCDVCPGHDDMVDSDHDGLADGCDNCPLVINRDQADNDGDDVGDLCDLCPGYDDKADADADGIPDDCDICPGYSDLVDSDADSVPDGCDICPGYSDHIDNDIDDVPDSCDNCPDVFNPDQADKNGNGIGDACDFICGDANGDGSANVGDAVFLISYVFKGGAAPDPVCAGDANGDNQTNVGDAVYMITYVFKGGAAPIDPCCP